MPADSLSKDCHPDRSARAFAFPTLGRAGAQPKDLRFPESARRRPSFWLFDHDRVASQVPPSPLFVRAKYSKQRPASQSIPFIGLRGKVLRKQDLP